MARHFSDRPTDQHFAESILKAIDEGYERILIVGTTRPFTEALMSYIANERNPERFSWQLGLRYPNGQHVSFRSDRSNSRGRMVDRVLVHPLTSSRSRLAAIPCEKRHPIKLTPVGLVIDDGTVEEHT